MENRINDIINTVKVNELFHKKEQEEKKKNLVLMILSIIGIVTLIAGIAFAVYKFVKPDYYEDDDIDFDDDFDFEDFEE